MAQVSVLLNSGAGVLAATPEIANRAAAALRASGIDAKIELVSGGEFAEACRTIAGRDPLLVVGGGDGTLSVAASALVDTETLLGILPLGTLNHFARDLRVPMKLEEAAALIARRPERRVDVGEMNHRIFINNSAIGLYPLMVVDRDVQRKKLGRSKRLAMIIASIRTLARFNHQRLTLSINDEKELLDTPLLFVGNNDYRIDLAAPGRRESIDRGELSLFVMRKKTRRGFIAASIRALFDRARGDDMVRIEHVERIRVSSRRNLLPVSIDGEVVRAAPPLDYRIRKKALRVIAP